jgi:O-antigen/teichoic acid export membrane protein
VFQIYLLALPLRITSYGTILRAVGDTRGILTSTLWSLGATAILSPILCFSFGPLGAAAGYVVSQFVAVGYLLRRISRHSELSVAQMIPWASLTACLALVVPCALISRLATQVLPPGLLRLSVAAPLFGILWAVALLRTRLLLEEDRALLRSWWSRLNRTTASAAPSPVAAPAPAVSSANQAKDV